jgi:hypothetical protein
MSEETGIKPEIVSKEYLNKTKNWLNHWKDVKDNDTEEIDIEMNAIQYIIRAINNLVCYDQSCTSESPRFIKWITENKKELFSEFNKEQINQIQLKFNNF